MKAAIYTRISKDRDGNKLGVQRQLTECTALADRLGWDVVTTLTDNDVSACTSASKSLVIMRG